VAIATWVVTVFVATNIVSIAVAIMLTAPAVMIRPIVIMYDPAKLHLLADRCRILIQSVSDSFERASLDKFLFNKCSVR
jgi:hypothetical protein